MTCIIYDYVHQLEFLHMFPIREQNSRKEFYSWIKIQLYNVLALINTNKAISVVGIQYYNYDVLNNAHNISHSENNCANYTKKTNKKQFDDFTVKI